MFRQPNQAYMAKQPPPKPARSELEKQLFPSSSPSVKRDGDIGESFKKAHRPGAFGKPSAGLRTTEPTDPLSSRHVNTVPPPRPPIQSIGSRNFASIVGNSNTFQDKPEVIDLVTESQATSKSSVASVLFEMSDFSDDDQLDLSYEAPSALPAPSRPAAKPATKPTPPQMAPPPPTNTSAVSWSSSPPSHYLAPQPARSVGIPAKRASTDDGPDVVRAAKRRELPWPDPSKVVIEEDDLDRPPPTLATPAPKEKNQFPWDTTASGVKAQKKQLKGQTKGSAPAQTDLSMEEIKDVVQSRTVQKSGITLSNEQRHVKTLVVDKNKSVFFTGPAGTGKSVLMRAIIADLRKKFARDPERVAVTASTGLAACNIGGMTLHSFSGIGLGKEDVATLVKKIRRNPKAKNRWIKTKVLIIDEVSMVDGDLFDKLSQIGRTIRNNGRPWGGIQLVITGDFFQLPPVPDKYEAGKARDIKFAFEAATWATSIDHTIGLTEVFRQRDPVFAQMLNEMRLGRISEETVRNFRALQRPLRFDDDIEVTELFPTRTEVDSSNQKRLAGLQGKSYRYASMDTGDPTMREKLLSNMMAPPALELKKGAQVMLIKNMDDTLVNGSLGKVVGFMSESTFEMNYEGYGSDPEQPAESLNFRKRLKAFTSALEESAAAKAKAKGDTLEYPLVKFRAVDGSERNILCIPEEWKVELPTGEVQASRKQIPLILAWALSIHKAQGQTLERVKVDLGKVFEKGQAYVALSRATTQQGLQVLRFQKDKVMAHPRVVGFYNKLYSVETVISKKTQSTLSNFAYTPGARAESQALGSYAGLEAEEAEVMSAYG